MSHRAVVPESSYHVLQGGQVCLDAQPGSLVLVRHRGVIPAAIRLAERMRVPRPYCWCNHACVTLTGGPNATVAQAEARGIVETPIAELDAECFAVVDVEMTVAQRRAVVAFARWSLGCGYGFAEIAADAWNALSGLELSLGWGNRMVCSTAACRAMERSGFIPARSPGATTPAHLAWWFGVRIPTAPVSVEVGPSVADAA